MNEQDGEKWKKTDMNPKVCVQLAARQARPDRDERRRAPLGYQRAPSLYQVDWPWFPQHGAK